MDETHLQISTPKSTNEVQTNQKTQKETDATNSNGSEIKSRLAETQNRAKTNKEPKYPVPIT
jgi:hypothetical protein